MKIARSAGNVYGLVAPIWWGCAIVVCGSLRPGYSHFTQYISELGDRGSSTELLMRYGGFVPTGVMHAAFAAFLYAAFKGQRLAALGASLIALNGIARIGAGVFPCAPGCAGPRVMLADKLHSLSAGVGFAAFIGAAIVWGMVARRGAGLRLFSAYSFFTAIVASVFLLLMVSDSERRAAVGLYERVSSAALSVWLLIFAGRIGRPGGMRPWSS